MKRKKSHLDKDEKDILVSYGRNEWKPVKNINKEKSNARKTAEKTFESNL